MIENSQQMGEREFGIYTEKIFVKDFRTKREPKFSGLLKLKS